MDLIQNLEAVKKKIPKHVELIAVSKTKPAEWIHELYLHGHRAFGENKVQELCDKAEILPKDIQWHLIGHLQRNKVKYIAPFVHLIHAVDSLKLLEEIDKRAAQNNRCIDYLFQVHIAEESSKFGWDKADLINVLERGEHLKYANTRLRGFMGMATFTEVQQQVSNEFTSLNKLFTRFRSAEIDILSMGMSGDYELAIEHGSTMIRVGSQIFGERNY
jgi:pyridoxal phosphate enzyme (YggS family)